MGLFDSTALGSAITEGSSLLGGLLSGIFQKRAQKRQNKFQLQVWNDQKHYQTAEREAAQEYTTAEREAAQAYNTSEREAAQDWNYNMWQEQNAYDSPEAQRQRLVDAGYNPLLLGSGAFGSSSPVSGSSGSSISGGNSSGASVGMPEMQPESFVPDFVSMAQMALAISQMRNIDQKTIEQQQKNAFNPYNYATELEMHMASLSHLRLQIQDLRDALPYNSKRRQQSLLLGDLMNEAKQYDNEFIKRTLDERVEQCAWATNISARQWESLGANIDHIRKSIDKMDSEMTLMEAQKRHWANQDAIAAELKPFQIEEYKSRIFATRVNTHLQALQVPKAFRGAVVAGLDKYGPKGFIDAIKGNEWYSDPKPAMKLLFSAAGLLNSNDDEFKGNKELKDSYDKMFEEMDSIQYQKDWRSLPEVQEALSDTTGLDDPNQLVY